MNTKTCNISEMVQDMVQGYYDRLIGSHICTFSWYQNQWPWMTLNGRNALLQKNNVLWSPPEKNEWSRPILSATKCRL